MTKHLKFTEDNGHEHSVLGELSPSDARKLRNELDSPASETKKYFDQIEKEMEDSKQGKVSNKKKLVPYGRNFRKNKILFRLLREICRGLIADISPVRKDGHFDVEWDTTKIDKQASSDYLIKRVFPDTAFQDAYKKIFMQDLASMTDEDKKKEVNSFLAKLESLDPAKQRSAFDKTMHEIRKVFRVLPEFQYRRKARHQPVVIIDKADIANGKIDYAKDQILFIASPLTPEEESEYNLTELKAYRAKSGSL